MYTKKISFFKFFFCFLFEKNVIPKINNKNIIPNKKSETLKKK